VRTRRPLLLVLLVVGLTAGCGDAAPDMTDAAAAELATSVRGLRLAAEAGDHDTAAKEIVALRATVLDLATTGAITPDRATRVLAAVARLEAELAGAPSPPPSVAPPAQPQPQPAETRPPAADKKGESKRDDNRKKRDD
jgi:ribosomal protein S20